MEKDNINLTLPEQSFITKLRLLSGYLYPDMEIAEIRPLFIQNIFSSIYCNSLWCPVNESVIKEAKVAYNDSFRLIMRLSRRGSASEMFCVRNIRDFSAMRRMSAFSLLTRLALSGNTIINSIVNCRVFTESAISRSWRDLLFTK